MNRKETGFTKRSGLAKLVAGVMVCAMLFLTPRPAAAQSDWFDSLLDGAVDAADVVVGVAVDAADVVVDVVDGAITITGEVVELALDMADFTFSLPHMMCVDFGVDEGLCDVADLMLVAIPVGSAVKIGVASRSGRLISVPKGAAQVRARKYYEGKMAATGRAESSSKRHVTGNPSTTRPKSKKAKRKVEKIEKKTTKKVERKAKKVERKAKKKVGKKAARPKSRKAKKKIKKAKKKAKKVERKYKKKIKKVERKAKKKVGKKAQKADKGIAALGRTNLRGHNHNLDAAEKLLAKGKKCGPACRKQRSEIIGERTASKWMGRRPGPRCYMLKGWRGQGVHGIDQVWQCGKKMVLVEAKGGRSYLQDTKKWGMQNSQRWVEGHARKMIAKGSEADKAVGEKILRASEIKGRLKVKAHYTKVNGNGRNEVVPETWPR